MTSPQGLSEEAREASLEVEVSERAEVVPPILKLPDDVLNDVKNFVSSWFRIADAEHSEKVSRWKVLEKQYAAEMPASRNFPFEGASRVVIAVTAEAANPIYSRLINSICGQVPMFIVKATKKEMVDYVKPLQDWMEFYIRNVERIREEVKQALQEHVILGTSVYKTVRDKDVRHRKSYGPDGKTILEQDVVVFDGPKTYWVPLDDFLVPEAGANVQDAPAVFHRARVSWQTLKAWELSGKVQDVNEIQQYYVSHRTEIAEYRSSLQKASINYLEEYELYEVWFDYDIDRSGQAVPLIGLWEPMSERFIQLRLNWYFHQRRPFTVIPFMPVAGRIYGRGVGDMAEPYQEEVTTLHRIRDDNGVLANTRMYIAKRNAPGMEKRPRIYTGKTFFVDDPTKDLIPFAAADIYPSLVQEEMVLQGHMEKLIGVGDYMQGRESPIAGSRATATSTLALIQEGNKRVQQVMDEIHEGFKEIINYHVEIWNQFGVGDLPFKVLGEEAGRQVVEILTQPDKLELLGGIGFELSVSNATQNKEIQKQLILSLIQILQGYYDRLIQGAMIVANPQVPPLVKQTVEEVAKAQHALLKRTVELFDTKNLDEVLPNLEALIELGQRLTGALGPGGAPGAPGDTAGALEVGGMGAAGSAATTGAGEVSGGTPFRRNLVQGALPPGRSILS
jgi:hypothetical protein